MRSSSRRSRRVRCPPSASSTRSIASSPRTGCFPSSTPGDTRSTLLRRQREGTNCDRALDLVVAALPEHPALFPADATSDQPETFYVAEMIREKVFLMVRQEVPYAVAVRVDQMSERPEPACLYIEARIFVEHDSQRGILIGRGGQMLKRIGTAARLELARFFGIKVYLALSVEVRRAWRKDPR